MVKRMREEPTTTASDTLDEGYQNAKHLHTDKDGSSKKQQAVILCELPPHQPLYFTTIGEFEVHYQFSHVNRCCECHRNFPTEHFLHLHIAESHDPLSDARRAKGERTFHCFVEDCARVCSSALKRRMHLIDKHRFPKNYDFFIVNKGVDKRNSMLRPERRNPGPTPFETILEAQNSYPRAKAWHMTGEGLVAAKKAQTVESESVTSSHSDDPVLTPRSNAVDDDLQAITSSMSALRFVPPSVRFGRAKGGCGFAQS